MNTPTDTSWRAADLNTTYKEENAYNIFTNNLQLRKKTAHGDTPRLNESCWENDIVSMLSTELLAQIKGYRITIKNLHLRYEDDFYVDQPYSMGLTAQVRNFE